MLVVRKFVGIDNLNIGSEQPRKESYMVCHGAHFFPLGSLVSNCQPYLMEMTSISWIKGDATCSLKSSMTNLWEGLA